jgi:renalase
MFHSIDRSQSSVMTQAAGPRIAVVGAGIAGLTCAHELRLRGLDPVVFEASERLGGRCSSLATRVGWFDDSAQAITGATHFASYALQRPAELAAVHPWTVPATPAEDEPKGRDRDKDEDEADATRSLKLIGAVGVPSMRALAEAIAQPLDIRLCTPIAQAQRRGSNWVLRSAVGEIDEGFQALVLALPAPLALALARESAVLTAALRAVRYRNRWVLLLGSERPVGLPGYCEFEGSPIERVAAMHSKPGRGALGPQRWFIEAGERWSLEHAHDEAETVAELLLDNFRALVRRPVFPNFILANQWRHAFVETPAATPGATECLWDDAVKLGVCGDSVVPSRVDRVHRSGAALARTVADAALLDRERREMHVLARNPGQSLEAQAAHG